MIKLKDILKEVGEGTAPYKFRGGFSKQYRDGGKEYVYKFDAPAASYDVDILVQPLVDDDYANEWDRFVDPGIIPPEIMKMVKYGSEIADVSFSTEKGELEVNDYKEIFRVMSTVVETIKDLLKKEPAVKIIKYTAIKAEKEKDTTAITKRDKLYQAYIKKQIPSAKVIMEFGATYIILP